MLKILIIVSLLAFSAFALPTTMDDFRNLWTSWKHHHRKVYRLSEEALRFNIFLDNYKAIASFNAENEKTKLGLNQFADLTQDEFRQKYASDLLHSDRPKDLKVQKFENVGDLPEQVDWREKGAVTPVINQGQCGSSWATPITGTLETLHKIKSGELKALSIEQLLECDTESSGCCGGYLDKGYMYAAKFGLETEEDYPYTAQKGTIGTCKYDSSKAIKVNSGFKYIQEKSSVALKTALVEVSVATPIEADDVVFQFYKAGVIIAGCKASMVGHGVYTVGYKKVFGVEAFIVKNTWGTNWGQDGYVYISTDGSANGGLGHCGILSMPIAPNA